ncbi:pyridoxamine 5'-phosphate oxidase family protein [Paraburkholderia lacunae]|uniref:Pyridoxamine 5'-phosphate oxidase family protein n=1 Tax=Paraburkholderia lacunae TaxID=2211104 RepID=A0A370NCA7_9BURK|nr:pyridoxamine 5'-phosphate oxidase family protein [Paraburkholderia lacunae]
MALIKRSQLLLRTGRFMTLATVSPDGEPWASVVNYVPTGSPMKLTWYSMRDARHSINIEQNPLASGTIFRTDLDASPLGLDGAQFAGACRTIPDSEVQSCHRQYYEKNFPDSTVRQQWMLPVSEFVGHGARRFYELTVAQWWLFDIDRWLEDKIDARIEVRVSAL